MAPPRPDLRNKLVIGRSAEGRILVHNRESGDPDVDLTRIVANVPGVISSTFYPRGWGDVPRLMITFCVAPSRRVS